MAHGRVGVGFGGMGDSGVIGLLEDGCVFGCW